LQVLTYSMLELEGRVHVEALVHVLMMLSDSWTRRRVFDPMMHLPRMLAPLTNIEYFHSAAPDPERQSDFMTHVAASATALMAALHTWPGVFYLFSTRSGVESVVEVIRLGQV
jgi:hypothetical protein